ncbi:MAG: pantoate--beta-alanine ligase [Spirochaetota bacterium]|nr:pantoate--beta-alanine ligase [Spirochaetota bacterium]
MEIVKDIQSARERINNIKKEEKRIGFVPTMGFLHKGHLSCVEISKKYSDYQVMSIFVNPIQFNNKNDFDTYPKDIMKDFELAEKAGIDLIFLPDDSEMYKNHLTYVNVETLSDHLCGAVRPGHFKGVFTVVSKLFNILLPDVSVFGQKDIQQAVSIEKMVLDLNFPIKIIIAPTVREDDGIAMSSRNKHLDQEQREKALSIIKSLRRAEEIIAQGSIKSKDIIIKMNEILRKGNPDKIDYISIVDYNNLYPVDRLTEKNVIAVAAFFGETRLIDNMIIEKNNGKFKCIY